MKIQVHKILVDLELPIRERFWVDSADIIVNIMGADYNDVYIDDVIVESVNIVDDEGRLMETSVNEKEQIAEQVHNELMNNWAEKSSTIAWAREQLENNEIGLADEAADHRMRDRREN